MTTIVTLASSPEMPQKWQPKRGFYFKNFIQNLSPEGFDNKAKEVLTRESLNILGNCRNPNDDIHGPNSTGSVIGYVQSGKTTSFMSVASAALDNGYNFIIVLGGRNTPLYNQNSSEFEQNFEYAVDDNKAHVFSVDLPEGNLRDIDTLPLSSLEQDTSVVPATPVIAVILKHQDHIRRLTRLIKKNKHISQEMNTLIIDDEADSASLNSLVNDGDESSIYKEIRKLRDALPKHSLLQYTATPQALLLTSRNDHYSPEWARIISPGEKYTGTESLFSKKSLTSRTIPSEDNLPRQTTYIEELPNSFYEALRTYLLTASQSYLTPKKFGKKISLMIHPAREVAMHEVWGSAISQEIDDWKSIINMSGSKAFMETHHEDFLSSYKGLKETNKTEISSFDELFDLVPKVIKMLIVTTLNADNTNVNSKRKVSWKSSKFHILIGGNLLDRGFVVKGLVTTYMPRSAGVGNSDTIQQRGRFYGYKKDHIGFIRTWLSQDTERAFKSYANTEKDLYTKLKNFSLQEPPKSLKHWIRSMVLDPALKPCRKSIISIDLIPKSLNRAGWFWTKNPLPLKHNLNAAERLIDAFEGKFKEFSLRNQNTGLWSPNMQSLIASNLSLQKVTELLLDFKVDDTDQAGWASTQMLLGNLNDQGYSCSIVLIGTNSKKFKDFAFSKSGSAVFRSTGLIHQGPNEPLEYPGAAKIISNKRTEITLQFHKVHLGERKIPSLIMMLKLPRHNVILETRGHFDPLTDPYSS